MGEPADLSGIVSATTPTRPVDPADGIPPGPPVVPGIAPPEPDPKPQTQPAAAVVAPPIAMPSAAPMRGLAAPKPAAPPPPAPPRPSPPAPSEQIRAKGWIESGLYVMTLPIAITVGVMYAPVAWFLSGRSRG